MVALEEGDKCPHCDGGTLEYVMEGDCRCHLFAPCSTCLDAVLACDSCDMEV